MKALLVFCEGHHDVVFVRRSLGAVAKGQYFRGKIRELPAPFGSSGGGAGLIKTEYGRHELDDRLLNDAAHARPPTFEAVISLPNEPLCFVVRCGGNANVAGNLEMIERVANLVPPPFREPAGVDAVAFAFVLDADDAGVAAREAQFASDYAACLDGQPASHAGWVKGARGPVGLFVFHESRTLRGTLEDALVPMVRDAWPERWDAAGHYLDAHAKQTDSIHAKAAGFKKARISVAGQFVCPGEPMSRVIDRGGLPTESFTGPASQALVAFLRAVCW